MKIVVTDDEGVIIAFIKSIECLTEEERDLAIGRMLKHCFEHHTHDAVRYQMPERILPKNVIQFKSKPRPFIPPTDGDLA